MRVSTSMLYSQGIAGVQDRQHDMLRLQQQLSSGQRMLVPSDDPVAAAQALDLKQSRALNQQYQANGDTAKAQLMIEEGALESVTSLLQDVRTLAVYAGDAALTDQDRLALAAEVKNRYDELLALANQDNGNGQFLFSGYQGATQPFAQTAPGVVAYAGDGGSRMVRLGPAHVVAIGDSGDAVFRDIKNGNGAFVAAPAGANAGTGVVSPGTVTNPAAWNAASNPRDFTIAFHVDNSATPPRTSYDIVDNVNNISLLTGVAPAAGPHLRAYTPGTAISLARQAPPDTNPAPFDFGASVAIDGVPANGDSFGVQASARQDLFATIHGLLTALQTGTGGGPAAAAAYRHGVNAAMTALDNALDNVLTVRAEVGARLNEIDSAQAAGADTTLNYEQRLSQLQDLDYAQAISDLNWRQTQLDAAQKSFLKVTSLSLFNLI
jgi:flagellar hook-associated protein 3 FlgL